MAIGKTKRELKLQRATEFYRADKLDEAHAYASALLNETTHDPRALFIAAMCNLRAGRSGIAYHLLQRCMTYEERPEILNNMVAGLHNDAHHEEGLLLCQRALTYGDIAKADELNLQASLCKDPAELARIKHQIQIIATTYNNLSSIHCDLGNVDDAIEAAENAVRALPGYKNPLWNASLAHLKRCNWVTGFRWYNEALGTEHRPIKTYDDPNQPFWAGEPDSVPIVYSEQGIGDEIMWASLIPDAIARARHVVIDAEPRLVGAFKRSFPKATVSSSGKKNGPLPLPEGTPKATHRIGIGSLGYLFRAKDEDFPGKPYLQAEFERRIQWRALLDHVCKKGRLRIGFNWQGGIPKTGEKRRSLTLEEFAPLMSIGGEWINLNHRPEGWDDLDAFKAATGRPIHHWDRLHGKDFDDTLAVIAECDLVISVTTTVIHAAGALGVPCWVLVPENPTWRYLESGDRMPWYNSVRLFRQKDGEWPIREMAERLRQRVEMKRAG